MNTGLLPEDNGDASSAVSDKDLRSHAFGPIKIAPESDVLIIKPSNLIGRLGIPQVWEYKHLLKYFVLRSIRGRYRATSLGYGWILFRPILLCLVYVLIFGYLVGIETGATPYPLFVFVGISLYLFFSGIVSDTAASLTNNASIMSKVYYPRLIAPLTSLFVNFTDVAASFVVIGALMVFYQVLPGSNVIFFPLYMLGLAVASFALGLVLAAHSIKRRDIMMGLPVILRVMVYAMPCVYPITMVPESLLNFYYMNPMASLIQGIRWSLFGDLPPPAWSVISAVIFIFALMYYGLAAFTRAERTMVDSL
ncbi:ABC transporter permease [Thalassospira sp. ER-Se-21-Dark]|uniref:ABC transporter permease n=1 Tax=Thalassospira sp. ER-Se-21-Dark TaxID=2585190 RepID=UPI001B30AF5D|nr:ABC transporter permease [Thalassospira sp. ER-Se-21-Dark]